MLLFIEHSNGNGVPAWPAERDLQAAFRLQRRPKFQKAHGQSSHSIPGREFLQPEGRAPLTVGGITRITPQTVG